MGPAGGCAGVRVARVSVGGSRYIAGVAVEVGVRYVTTATENSRSSRVERGGNYEHEWGSK